jgi:mono/diheme cytochrome c family protein
MEGVMSLISVSTRVLAGIAIAGFVTVPIVGAGGSPGGQQRARFEGSDVFRTYCAVCHGASAKGDGPLASGLKKPPADLTLFARNNKGVFPKDLVVKIVDGREPVKGHGGGDMPVWGDAFSKSLQDSDPDSVKQKIEAVVGYLESLQQK